ncbi:THUMP-like domain-containing protein [Thermocatellispora tengchongensis]|uniref:THUMP-like domain-containing protein n=1 Tax=Thermocatellispora tengchongensis TaxID=1073253 RepID=UPI001613B074|nr:SAM-dependent methyltransferase [Thermocatellispora tengchongensis]
MNLDGFLELLTSPGQLALARAEELTSRHTPVTAASLLRRDHSAELVSAALTQAQLRARAAVKFGAAAARMYFTPDGLEQATRAEVAAHRARRLAGAAGASGAGGRGRVADLCCGIGGDLLALAAAGCAVEGFERDELTAAVARANIEALGLSGAATVRTAGAAEADPGRYDAVFIDPARRTSARRVFDPMAYSPPWPEVMEIAAAAPAACVKAAPGLPYEFVPEGAEVEWVSYRGEVKEAAIWLGAAVPEHAPEAGTGGFLRRATLQPSGVTLTGGGEPRQAERGPAGRYLYEPDGAAIRAHLVAEVADIVRGRLLDPHIAYITGDEPVSTPWASCYEILEMMPFSGKRLRAALRERNVGTVTIKKRGSAVDIERLRRDLRLSGDESLVVVLTRIDDKPYALLCAPVVPANATAN